jgi:hypothetical protein
MDSIQTLPDKKYYVLLMTAAVVACDAQNDVEAAHRALLQGPPALDPTKLQWVVRLVDDKPIYLGEEDEAEIDVVETADTPTLKVLS